jgi:hypothetical protein
MKERIRPYRKDSATEVLLLRDRLGMKRYRKRLKRNPEEKEILLELALNKIRKAEKNSFLPIGFRKRRVKLLP